MLSCGLSKDFDVHGDSASLGCSFNGLAFLKLHFDVTIIIVGGGNRQKQRRSFGGKNVLGTGRRGVNGQANLVAVLLLTAMTKESCNK